VADHAVLVLPSANRVYAQQGPELLAAELAAMNDLALDGALADISVDTIAGVPYVTFAGELNRGASAVVSNLSAAYAMFERDGETLRPVTMCRLDRWDGDLVTIQRYSGKTNEQVTRLLLNLTVAATCGTGAFTGDVRPRVLDPLAGRGTTLNAAVLYGFDAAGIDVDKRDVDAYVQFFTTWLKDKRAKHTSRRTGTATTITFAPDKDAQKRGAEQEVVAIAGETTDLVRHLGKSSVDMIVTDLPYGVQHGSRAGGTLRRSPADLLTEALPVWRSVLRPGGAMGLAWNTRVLDRDRVVSLLRDGGLAVVTGDPFGRFAHRVDQAVTRDVVVARRP
jgi:SAM-dependent methyltransferase